MKKILLGIIISLSFILVGCVKPVAAKVAALELVDSLIYDQDVEKLNEIFILDGSVVDIEPMSDYVSDLKESFELGDEYDQQLAQLGDKVTSNLKEKTSFKVNVLEETTTRARVELTVIGLEELSEKQLSESLEIELQKKMTELTADSNEEQINQLVNDVSFEAVTRLINNQQAKTDAITVNLDLMVDLDKKDKWVIQNSDTFLDELIAAYSY